MSDAAPPPFRARLKRIHIRDFRGVDELDLDFTGPDGQPLDLAVIAGENGCGKTTVLAAILALVGRHRNGIVEADVRFGASHFELSGELSFTGAETADDNPIRIVQDSRNGFSLGVVQAREIRSPLTGAAKRALQSLDVETYSASRPLSVGRDLVKVAQMVSVDAQANEGMRLPDLHNRLVSAYYREMRDRARPGIRSNATLSPFARLQAWWRRFVPRTELDVIPRSNDPGSGDEVVVRDGARPIPADVTSLTMACEIARGRSDVPKMVTLDRSSSGQLAILAFAGPIIFRDQSPDIVLIDEPEQHLHVRWQREILPALRALSPATQFIVATHSEEILGAALSYERFILVDEGDPRIALAVPGDAA